MFVVMNFLSQMFNTPLKMKPDLPRQAVEGGLEKVEELKLRANFNGARSPLQILVSLGDEIIHKYTTKEEAEKDLIISIVHYRVTQCVQSKD